MKLLLVSDTHGNYPAIFKAHQQAGGADGTVHAGDGMADAALLESIYGGTVLKVAGNCDPASSEPREIVTTIEGKRLLITHGDAYRVKSGLHRLLVHGRKLGVDLILYGHTHIAMAEKVEGIMLVNPGTLCKQSTEHSYAIVYITPEGIEAAIYKL